MMPIPEPAPLTADRRPLGLALMAQGAYLLMILLNVLANALPLNGVRTAEVSDSYPSLFAPAGFTFAIWGLIYLLLAIHGVFRVWDAARGTGNNDPDRRVCDRLYAVSSVANGLWILAWHFGIIWLSMVLMLVVLVCLSMWRRQVGRKVWTRREFWTDWLPFGVYWGWISVATVANAAVLLLDINWGGFGVSDEIWTVVLLAVGVALCALVLFAGRNVPYALVFLWAYFGILRKHVVVFPRQYPAVHLTVNLAMVGMVALILYTLLRKKRPVDRQDFEV